MDMRVAAYAVITDDDDRVLLAHWIDGRRAAWTLPGGGLEAGEDPVHAVRREVREETGFRVTVGDLLGIHSRVIPAEARLSDDSSGPLHTLRIVYRARIVGGRLRNETDGSTDRAEWFTLPAARKVRRVQLVDIALRMADLRP
ncbi:8-oxo-dGTP diphosphatase [Microbacterium sp. SORGH_AS 1204]|uniref:NUDIX hydrolase n=1 Tax=Microbacterium sp. SORGH_AS_1204 TaxID=3041785 RepID=UPI0027902ADE|nr:NUDIX hydrolase [Microbacterium sp. SORGH_AS_1204]MDQ1138486.1 8-oxo-dGTP diphosphatase [Microbacterium sp. SORGH_AS_1204]